VAATEAGGKVYVAGGWDGSKYLRSVEVYDTAASCWVNAPRFLFLFLFLFFILYIFLFCLYFYFVYIFDPFCRQHTLTLETNRARCTLTLGAS
jgi:hypothetical protein